MITVEKASCPQNHPCPMVRVCPTGAIVQKGYGAPEIVQEKCINCRRCVLSCRAFQDRNQGL